MSRHTVIWDPYLEDRYTDAWVDADSTTRDQLTAIANWIDAELAIDAETKGVELLEIEGERIRQLIMPVGSPQVAVVYQVLPDDRQVRVIRIIIR